MSIRDDLEELEDAAVAAISSDLQDILDALVDEDGLTYGDEEFESEEDFMLFYQDLRDRGVLEFLAVIDPDLTEKYARRYARGVEKMAVR